MKVLFLHGWHSVPGGVKPTCLKDHGHELISPALDDDDFAAALAVAQAEFDRHQPDVVVGSSRGGALAMNINCGNARLVLLGLAWKKWRPVKTVKSGTVILHSRADDVVPFGDSEELAKISGATLIEVGTDHRLAEVARRRIRHHRQADAELGDGRAGGRPRRGGGEGLGSAGSEIRGEAACEVTGRSSS